MAKNRPPTHKDCINLSDGVCTLTGVAVDPNAQACPNFTPKTMAARTQTARVSPEALQVYQPYAPQNVKNYAIHGYHPRYVFGWCSSLPDKLMQGSSGFAGVSARGGGRGGMGGFGAREGGRGRGRMGGVSAGPGGSCVCPNCGYTTSHIVGTPCYQQTCPRCVSKMTRRS